MVTWCNIGVQIALGFNFIVQLGCPSLGNKDH